MHHMQAILELAAKKFKDMMSYTMYITRTTMKYTL